MSWTLPCVFSASQLPLCASMPSVCVLALNSLPHPPLLPVPSSLLSAASLPHLCSSLLSCLCSLCPHSLPSLCFFAIPLLSLLPLSVTQLAPVSLCLFALSLPYLLSASVPSAPPSLLSRSPSSFSSLSLPQATSPTLISGLMNELLKDGSSVSVLHPRELPEGSGGAVAAGGHPEDGEDPQSTGGADAAGWPLLGEQGLTDCPKSDGERRA